MNEITFSKITLKDVPALHRLALENDGNKQLTTQNFKHWYLENPVKSNSMWKAELNNEVEGYATTNNFYYNIDGNEKLVALPQNVLTSEKIRGKGVFGKLYRYTEDENREVNKVDFFLTSTGEMSTAIFLEKFGYLRGVCPDVVIQPFSLLHCFYPKTYQLVSDLNSIELEQVFDFNYGRKKTIDYLKWRYRNCSSATLKILQITKKGEKVGYAFLIVQRKKKMKVLTLVDLISRSEDEIPYIMHACSIFFSKNGYPILMYFRLNALKENRGLKIRLKNRFNFLVKGKSNEDSVFLSKMPFNYFLGDLDYFWD